MHHLSRADFDAAIFDLDGVITDTAKVHAAVVEADVRRFPAPTGARDRRAVPLLRDRSRLHPLRRRQAALRRCRGISRIARHQAAMGEPERRRGQGHDLGPRQSQEPLFQRAPRPLRRRRVRKLGGPVEGAEEGGHEDRAGVVEPQRFGRDRSCRADRAVRRPHRRQRPRTAGAQGQAGARSLPRRRRAAGRDAQAGDRGGGRHQRRCCRAGRRFRPRHRHRPAGRAGGARQAGADIVVSDLAEVDLREGTR